MAKQAEGLQLQGTIGWITFYCLNGKYYARRRSKLKRKTVKYSPKFTKTRQYANWLGRASSLTAALYRSLPKERQVYAFYCELRSLAYGWLKEGISEEDVRERLDERVKPRELKKAVSVRKMKKARVPSLSSLFVCLPVKGRKSERERRRQEVQQIHNDSS